MKRRAWLATVGGSIASVAAVATFGGLNPPKPQPEKIVITLGHFVISGVAEVKKKVESGETLIRCEFVETGEEVILEEHLLWWRGRVRKVAFDLENTGLNAQNASREWVFQKSRQQGHTEFLSSQLGVPYTFEEREIFAQAVDKKVIATYASKNRRFAEHYGYSQAEDRVHRMELPKPKVEHILPEQTDEWKEIMRKLNQKMIEKQVKKFAEHCRTLTA